jgi:hypothetical protein
MENLTSYQYAEQISESIINGQHKQALDQFARAMADYCEPDAILQDIAGILDAEKALVFAARVIKGSASL